MVHTRLQFARCVAFASIVFGVRLSGLAAEHALGSSADVQVRQALQQEAAGTLTERAAVLQPLVDQSPDSSSARWHAGYVRWKGDWVKSDSTAVLGDYRTMISTYEAKRAQAKETVAEQMKLADWCHANKLLEQERAHLAKVLEKDNDHAEARRRAGYAQVSGQWFLKADIDAARKLAVDASRWVGPLKLILTGLKSKDPQARSTAAKKLLDISDPAALPAIELVLGGEDEAIVLRMIDAIARTTTAESALALAKIAVRDPYSATGEAATLALRKKPPESYVPRLLDELSTPINHSLALYQDQGWRTVVYEVFTRELEDRKQQLGIGHVGVGSRTGLARSISANEVRDVSREVADQNAALEATNNRIFHVLAKATGESLLPQPEAWWSWWYARNEIYMAYEKPTERKYQVESIQVYEPPPPAAARRCECLAAGTPVWTATGFRAIETMQAGDVVLSQDIETGELSYQAVLKTTIRPPGPLVRIETERDKIRASGGHLFWVSGRGWVRARLLEPGMKLHDVSGVTTITAVVDEGGQAPTYNLIVNAAHSYFVGQAKILSHDNTMPEPSEQIVPGLAARH